jgi:hypothetical protein
VSYSLLSIYVANLLCQHPCCRFDHFPSLNHAPFHSLTSHSLNTSLPYTSYIHKMGDNMSTFSMHASPLFVIVYLSNAFCPLLQETCGMFCPRLQAKCRKVDPYNRRKIIGMLSNAARACT